MPDPSKEAQHALFAFVAELPTRRSINTHIVIVGASECGLSVIEGLLFHPTLSFNAVTLLAPGGVSGTGAYAAPLLTRLVSSSLRQAYAVYRSVLYILEIKLSAVIRLALKGVLSMASTIRICMWSNESLRHIHRCGVQQRIC